MATPVRALFMKVPKGGTTNGLAFGIDPARYGAVDKTPVEGVVTTGAPPPPHAAMTAR